VTDWKIEFTRAAQRDLAELPEHMRRAVGRDLDRLARDPQGLDIKKLGGRVDDWRLRVGAWRVIFVWDHATHTIIVQRIRPRNEAYR
jgi:mRNA interferase RelE/StbE